MYRVCKPNGIICIMDIPDIEKKEEYLKVKPKESHSLKRLFYSKSFFEEKFENVCVEDHFLKGYENSKYRFNDCEILDLKNVAKDKLLTISIDTTSDKADFSVETPLI